MNNIFSFNGSLSPFWARTIQCGMGSKRTWHWDGTKVDKFRCLRQVPGLTSQQCRDVLDIVHEEEGESFRHTAKAQAQKFPEASKMIREIKLPGNGVMAIASLPQVLNAKLQKSTFLQEMAARAVKQHGNQWDLILAWDEATPGNVLRPDLERKAALTYASFAQWPVPWNDESWLTLAIARSADLQKSPHSFPASFRIFVNELVSETQDGFLLDIPDDPNLIQVRSVSLVADADGLRLLTGCKGASGLKCCFKCTNVLSKKTAVPGHESITNPTWSCFKLQTQQQVVALHEHLSALSTRALLEEHEKLLGWHRDTLGASFLMDPICAAQCALEDTLYDAMHCFLSNGIVTQELGLFWTRTLDKTKVQWCNLEKYVSSWCIGNSYRDTMRANWHPKNWKYDRDYRGGATETLIALPLLLAFALEVLAPVVPCMQKEIDCLHALNSVIRAWLACKDNGPSLSKVQCLRDAQQKHLKLFVDTYGSDLVRPKHHFSLHLPEQLSRKGWSTDCFPAERRHSKYKRVAQSIRRLSSLAKSCLLEMNQQEIDAKSTQCMKETFFNQLSSETSETGAVCTLYSMLKFKGCTFARGNWFVLDACTAFVLEAVVSKSNSFFFWARHSLPNLERTTFRVGV